ncbi:hypothetical protein CFAM422_004204 [Trichoderma lentiforme]|uniref:Uncharacterized protein n=1 Tax=Trichoderma lentiforme TaxID=1567552 RepID=A0A9P4XIV9_9HYPO|nr:hypothetical protein CFAM422_004204 [Trichoderma lentiforme]
MTRFLLASLATLLAVATAQITTPSYAVNPNAPTITDAQLAQVLFRCTDQAGGIVGNSYCIVNCAVIGDDTVNDMCTM